MKKDITKSLEKYKDIKKWHGNLQSEAISISELNYQQVERYPFHMQKNTLGWIWLYGTQIKNYPVQGFATADIVPLACINIYKLMQEQV